MNTPSSLEALAALVLTALSRDINFLVSQDWLWWLFAVPGMVVSVFLAVKWVLISFILTAPFWVPFAIVFAAMRSAK